MKFLSVLVLLVLAVSAASAQVVIQTKSFYMDRDTPGYAIDKNSGERSATIEVTFDKPFEKKPTVIIAVNLLDASKDGNQRYSVKAVSVSRDGFTIQVKTWGDSKVFGIGGDWMAFIQ